MLKSTFPLIQKFFTPFMFGIVILFEAFHDDTNGMKKQTNWNASKPISNPFDDYEFYMFKKATFCLLGNISLLSYQKLAAQKWVLQLTATVTFLHFFA